eukprot:scaffold7841_cov88-Phaeocystis_antarctica.AAC.1
MAAATAATAALARRRARLSSARRTVRAMASLITSPVTSPITSPVMAAQDGGGGLGFQRRRCSEALVQSCRKPLRHISRRYDGGAAQVRATDLPRRPLLPRLHLLARGLARHDHFHS